MDHIREKNPQVPEGGVALPLRYTIFQAPSYSVVPSNAIWQDPARTDEAAKLAKDEYDNARRSLYFPQVLRDARRISEYYPNLSPDTPECMDTLGISQCESACNNFYDSEEVRRVFYPEMEKLLLEFFPIPTPWSTTTMFSTKRRSNRGSGCEEPGRKCSLRQSGSQRSKR